MAEENKQNVKWEKNWGGIITSIRSYISKLIEVPGMKAMLLDQETTSIISLVYAQSQIIAKEVFLVERIDSEPKKTSSDQKVNEDVAMHHLKAICFIRPDHKTIQSLVTQLHKPKYKEYHIFFSNILKEEYLRELAEADEFEVIKQVQEYYADAYAVNPDVYHLSLPQTVGLSQLEAYWRERERRTFRRHVQGILSVLLSMKKRPEVRYCRASDISKRLAHEITQCMKEEASLFHFQRGNTEPLLLILDRRDDPVTPLLTQWTYQAMAHEILEIRNNRVDLSKVTGISKELREVVLSCEQDRFFRGSMFLNFGDLGASIKDLVEQYQHKVKSNQKIVSLEDMQRFVDQYPEFRQLAGNVSKHVTVMTELSHQVDKRDLMAVSEVEQDLACSGDHGSCLERVLRLLNESRLNDNDRLKLVLLYALRYEDNTRQIEDMKGILLDRCTSQKARENVKVVDMLLDYAGSRVRGGDLYGNKKITSKIASFFGAGLKGVENIYTQHKPVLAKILEQLKTNKLKPSAFPFVDGASSDSGSYEEVFVFMIGGITYEEALTVANFNADNPRIKIILGGSYIHNSRSFIADIANSK